MSCFFPHLVIIIQEMFYMTVLGIAFYPFWGIFLGYKTRRKLMKTLLTFTFTWSTLSSKYQNKVLRIVPLILHFIQLFVHFLITLVVFDKLSHEGTIRQGEQLLALGIEDNENRRNNGKKKNTENTSTSSSCL